jgi:hypothetical protein
MPDGKVIDTIVVRVTVRSEHSWLLDTKAFEDLLRVELASHIDIAHDSLRKYATTHPEQDVYIELCIDTNLVALKNKDYAVELPDV